MVQRAWSLGPSSPTMGVSPSRLVAPWYLPAGWPMW
nr:MAG TPA: hypothetical protein [Caudoviricetes sp.]